MTEATKQPVRCRLRLTSGAGTAVFLIPQLSPGQTSNTALALSLALSLGRTEEQLQQQLEHWTPSENRGQWKSAGGRMYYLDCYNSNPSSLRDSFAAFAMQTPEGPRLLVIGSMRELGGDAEHLHRETAAALPWAASDAAIFIGPYAEVLREGARLAKQPPGIIETYEATADAEGALKAFAGPVFLKGSRAFALEQLVPEDAVPVASPRDTLQPGGGARC